MGKNKVRLSIGGIDYLLTTDEDTDYMMKLGKKLDGELKEMTRGHKRLSQVQASVLCALDYADKLSEAKKNENYLKKQLQVCMEDAAKAKTEAEMSRRDAERLANELKSLKKSIKEKGKKNE